jgi:hypothetical protein
MSKRPTLEVFVGLPAVGKSHVRANVIAHMNDSDVFVYSTDDLIDQFAADTGVTYSEAFKTFVKDATQQADLDVVYAIEDLRSVVWDQTNMSDKKRRKILTRFPDAYKKNCTCILPPFNDDQAAEHKRRLENRPGKVIPAFIMRSMGNSFVLPSTNEGFNNVSYYDLYGDTVDRNRAADLFGVFAK